jgi:hypothetical protein
MPRALVAVLSGLDGEFSAGRARSFGDAPALNRFARWNRQAVAMIAGSSLAPRTSSGEMAGRM